MATKPEDFLEHAKKLQRSASSEVEYRAAITQAYAGALDACRKFEEALPLRSLANTKGTGSHDSLLQCLERPNSKLDYVLQVICKEVAVQMRQLKALRELASYETDQPIRVDQSEEAIEGAADVIAECSKGLKKIASMAQK